ncbi:MAG: DNA polymerase III subunit delta [Bacteroidota bacterium]
MTEYNKLINEIENKNFSPIYLFHGEEDYFINKLIEKISYNSMDESSVDFDSLKIYGRKSEENQEKEIIDFAKRFPLLGKFNLIIVKDAKNISDDFSLITSYLEKYNKNSILILTFNNSIDKRKKIFKISKSKGVVFESNKLYENQIYQWIEIQSKNKSVQLHPKSINIISEFVGNDLSQIENELDKLKLNSKTGDIIGPEEVEKIIGFSKEYNFFELTKEIGENNFNKSIKLATYMAKNSKKYPVPALIGTIYSFFNKIFIYHSLDNKNDAPKALGINPYFLNDYKKAALTFPMKRVSKIFNYLLEADKKSKGINYDGTDNEGILKELIYKILKSN